MDNTILGLTIALSTKGFNAIAGNVKALSHMAEQASKTGVNIDKLSKKIEKISAINIKIANHKNDINSQISNIGYSLAKLTSFAVPVKIAIDQEEAMVDLKKYVDFASEEDSYRSRFTLFVQRNYGNERGQI